MPPEPVPSRSERLPGTWSPDAIVKLECLRHGQHSAISRIEMKCQLCHDANRPGVIERRYVDAAELVKFAERLERDRREPDKVLCVVQSMRRSAL